MSHTYQDAQCDLPLLGVIRNEQRRNSEPSAGDGAQQVQRVEAGHASLRPMRMPGVPHFADGGRSRARDPGTSKSAGRTAKLGGQKLSVWQALGQGPAGQTELGRRTGLLPHQVNKRLSDLEHEGWAAPTGREVLNEGGHMEREWRRIEVTDG
jgi:hypothetical protein